MYQRLLLVPFCGLLLVAVYGCQGEQAAGGGSEQPSSIPVCKPVQRMVTNYEEFTGRTDAVQSVDIRARVTGYLKKQPFREGSEVREGMLLFEVDPAPYQAQYDQAVSQVKLNEASLKLAQSTLKRDETIAGAVSGGVSQQQIDQDRAAVDEAKARLDASRSSTEVYRLNLDFTKVTAPIDGQISRYYMTRGNLVNQDQTLLTTIVSLDPMYAYFDLDEPSLIRIKRAILAGRTSQPEEGLKILMGLASEEGYPHEGTINFVNNQVNSSTGSISMRGVFNNPRLQSFSPELAASTFGALSSSTGQGSLLSLTPLAASPGTRLLAPGMFVRIRLPIGNPFMATLVIDRAIQSDQGLKYVYVLDENNKVVYRKITTHALQPDGLRVIEGVKANEWVVVGGLQQVRPGVEVKPEELDAMPSLVEQPTTKEKGAKGKQP